MASVTFFLLILILFNPIDTDGILDIHKYLIKKPNTK